MRKHGGKNVKTQLVQITKLSSHCLKKSTPNSTPNKTATSKMTGAKRSCFDLLLVKRLRTFAPSCCDHTVPALQCPSRERSCTAPSIGASPASRTPPGPCLRASATEGDGFPPIRNLWPNNHQNHSKACWTAKHTQHNRSPRFLFSMHQQL